MVTGAAPSRSSLSFTKAPFVSFGLRRYPVSAIRLGPPSESANDRAHDLVRHRLIRPGAGCPNAKVQPLDVACVVRADPPSELRAHALRDAAAARGVASGNPKAQRAERNVLTGGHVPRFDVRAPRGHRARSPLRHCAGSFLALAA